MITGRKAESQSVWRVEEKWMCLGKKEIACEWTWQDLKLKVFKGSGLQALVSLGRSISFFYQ